MMRMESITKTKALCVCVSVEVACGRVCKAAQDEAHEMLEAAEMGRRENSVGSLAC